MNNQRGVSIAQNKLRVNDEIRSPKVRVIGPDGGQVGIMSLKDAMKEADSRGLDLVEIAPQANPPVCKIVDYGKFNYEIQKKEKTQRKNQQVSQLKEIRLHPNTDVHDVEFKARHASKFLEEGNKVKVAVIFKGRELAYKEHGEQIIKSFIEKLEDQAKIESDIKFEGRIMHVILAPQKIKSKKNK